MEFPGSQLHRPLAAQEVQRTRLRAFFGNGESGLYLREGNCRIRHEHGRRRAAFLGVADFGLTNDGSYAADDVALEATDSIYLTETDSYLRLLHDCEQGRPPARRSMSWTRFLISGIGASKARGSRLP